MVPAKVGTQPYGCVDIKAKSVRVGAKVMFKNSTNGEEWREGTVTEFWGTAEKPTRIFIDL